VFFKAGTNLAEQVVWLLGTAKLDKAKLGLLKKLLKGMTIIKTYGKMRIGQIVDLGEVPHDQEFVWGGHGLCSVEEYMAEGKYFAFTVVS
jgi:hypothetical protein